MSTPRWLPVMVRARQAAEDAAAQQLAQDRRDAEAARRHAAAEADRLDAMLTTGSLSVHGFLAAETARSAAAASYSAAVQRIGFTDQRVHTSLAHLGTAARSRRTVEKLAERVAEAERLEQLALAQREADDTGAARFARRNKDF